MEWLQSILIEHSAMQAVIIISMIIAVGLGLGKIHICGISLGVTWVFFAGIFAGHIGLSIDPQMLKYAESFGLALFVYELGLQVGPGFFSSFRTGGVKLNMLGFAVVAIGTLMAILMSEMFSMPMSDMVGVLCGATTNTPALGAAQQTLQQLGIPAAGAALSCAVTYPLGVVGVILAIILIRKIFSGTADAPEIDHDDPNKTFIASFTVTNPGIFDRTVKEVGALSSTHFVISRLWRDGQVSIPTGDVRLLANDRLLVVTTEREADMLSLVFGTREAADWNKSDIDWNAIDSKLVSKIITVSRPEINGKKLGSLRLRNSYGINISRVSRSGVQLLATPGLILQLGDRLTVVGEEKALDNVARVLGNATTTLKDPNMAVIFIGLLIGLLLGALPISVPGVAMPVRLGLAGGPIVAGILIGRFGPRFHMVTYTTRSANLMLRGIGLSLYLGCLGLESGGGFFDSLMKGDGLTWVVLGFVLTIVPILIVGLVAMKWCRTDFGSVCGMLCGSMANPMALTYAQDITKGDSSAVSYATVYPLGMFLRVVIAQVLVLLLVG